MIKPVQKTSLATAVFEQLRDHILSGQAAPGDTLPAERVLSDMLQVNRAAVREGLKRLEQAGLVAIQQGGNTKVLNYRRTAGLELLGSLLLRSDGTIDTGVVRSVLALRGALAPEVARGAANKATATAIDRLQMLADLMRAAEDDTAQLQDLAMEFWGALVDASGNIAYRLAFNSLEATYGQVAEHLRGVLTAELSAVDDYQAVAIAVAAGDARGAAVAASAIVRRGTDAVAAVLDAVDEAQR